MESVDSASLAESPAVDPQTPRRTKKVTASVPLATFPDDAVDLVRMQELLINAVGLAKDRGRNQVCSVADYLRFAITP